MLSNLMSLLGFARPPMFSSLSTKSNEQLAQMLLNNFGAFSLDNSDNFDNFDDSSVPEYVSLDSIRSMAKRDWTGDPLIDQNILLAKELLKRPALLRGLDQHGVTGARDGLISWQDLVSVIRGHTHV
ncbi:hypothetical protein [Pseudomonas trivialis]|uniref:hypothetical protein n=1 Tax=Pseudomonas trivialis TaxID=200450 RepID=UPI000A8EFD4F|nr:hypothetical protein [Pseudomonas trivialis]